MSPSRRLHYTWEYRRFFNQSEAFRLSECTIFRVPNDKKHFRLGITLKARGSSIERNNVKRQIREAFRKAGAGLGSFDYNVVVSGNKKMAYPYPSALGRCLSSQLVSTVQRRTQSMAKPAPVPVES